MQTYPTMKYLCGTVCLLLLVAALTSAAPSYSDYDTKWGQGSGAHHGLSSDHIVPIDNIRDLLEALIQREGLDERYSGLHQVVRKAGRSPSLRLRFGRRSDPSLYPGAAYLMAQQDHDDN